MDQKRYKYYFNIVDSKNQDSLLAILNYVTDNANNVKARTKTIEIPNPLNLHVNDHNELMLAFIQDESDYEKVKKNIDPNRILKLPQKEENANGSLSVQYVWIAIPSEIVELCKKYKESENTVGIFVILVNINEDRVGTGWNEGGFFLDQWGSKPNCDTLRKRSLCLIM